MSNIYISRVQIEGGFLDGLDVSLKNGLNTIIGARGTGKSTFIELIRYCLDVKGHTVESNNKAISHAKSVLNDGQITVTLSNDTETLSYSRTADSDPIPPISRDIKPPLIFSQTEIENVGVTSSGRMKLIDDFLSGLDGIQQQEYAEVAIVESYAAEISSLTSSISDVEDKLITLPQLKTQLSLLEQEEIKISNISSIAKEKSDDLKVLTDLYVKFNSAININNEKSKRLHDLQSLLKTFSIQSDDLKAWASNADPDDTELLHGFGIVSSSIDSATDILSVLIEQVSIKTEELRNTLQEVIKKGQILRSDIDKIQEGAGELARRRQALQHSISTLEHIKKDNIDKEKQIEELKIKRNASLARLSDLRKARTDMRVLKCQELCKSLKPKIKINIEIASQLDEYQQVLINALKGSGIKYNDLAPIISESIPPTALMDIIESNDIDTFVSLVSISRDRALRVINSLKSSTDKIATVLLDDEIKLELLDGSEYKDFSALSTGQRCTVILPIILEHTESILIVDQPEDHIDNAFIVETLISSITRRADKGQIIVSSHNANVPVLGNAETVIHLKSDGTRGFVIAEGGLDKVNIVNSISTVMEGGREAFNRRADFYGR